MEKDNVKLTELWNDIHSKFKNDKNYLLIKWILQTKYYSRHNIEVTL